MPLITRFKAGADATAKIFLHFMDIEAKFCLQWAGLLQHETGDEHQAFRVGVTWLGQ